MIRFYGLLWLITTAAVLYCVLDVILTDAMLVRNLPKVSWIMLLIFLPPIGVIAWFAGGRPSGTTAALGSVQSRHPSGRNHSTRGNPSRDVRSTTPVLGPEDNPEFVKYLEERERKRQEAERAAEQAEPDEDDVDG